MGDQVPALARPESLYAYLLVLPIAGSGSEGEEHGLAARQKLRPAMGSLPFLEMSQRLWGASPIRHLL